MIYLLICLKAFNSSDQRNLKHPNLDSCPTYSIGVELTQSCQSYYKEYSAPNLDPAYHINSSKTWINVGLYYCNYSNYDVRSGRYMSLINARGRWGVGLEAEGCNFINNNMTFLNTGVFYFTEGPHEVTIRSCTFISNQGADASIVGGTVFKLDMQDCYIKNNTANSRFGQINLAGRSSGDAKPSFNCQNVIFYNNRIWPILGQQTIALLTNFTTVTFTNCRFTVPYCESTSMVGLKGKDTSITFKDCCFYINYTSYLYSYYHVKFETSATGNLQFRGTNSFSGTESNAYNKNLVRSDKMIFNIDKCINDYSPSDSPTQTPYTDTRSPFTETQIPYTDSRSPFSETQIPYTDSRSPFTRIPTYTTSDSSSGGGGDDSGSCSDDDPFKKPFFILLIILAIILIIIAFCVGYYCAKKKKESKKSQTTELNDSLIKDEDNISQSKI